jgi:HD-GYP domain-containing protein (c-di-GMP phosphodiesterase class II)
MINYPSWTSALRTILYDGAEDILHLTKYARLLSEWVLENPDAALYQIMRLHRQDLDDYGFLHSLHCASLMALLAERMDYSPKTIATMMLPALTANVSILAKQNDWSAKPPTLTVEDQQLISNHPARSVKMLEAAGVEDTLWLEVVRDHHLDNPGHVWAKMLKIADVYTASVSPRLCRDGLSTSEALSQTLKVVGADKFAVILFKVLGLYPPGSVVKTEQHEIGVVITRSIGSQDANVRIWQLPNGVVLHEPQTLQRRILGSARAAAIGDLNESWDLAA